MLVAQFLISTYLFLFPSVQGLQENTVFIKWMSLKWANNLVCNKLLKCSEVTRSSKLMQDSISLTLSVLTVSLLTTGLSFNPDGRLVY
jgi:hypothetical protein